MPAPKRKYFQLNMSCMLAIGITRDAVDFVFQDIPHSAEEKIEEKELRNLSARIRDLEELEDPNERFETSDDLLKEINSRLKDLTAIEISLLRMKQRITRVAHKTIMESFDEELHRHILYSTIGEEKQPNVDQLSAMLDTREKEISQALKIMKQKMGASKKISAEQKHGAISS